MQQAPDYLAIGHITVDKGRDGELSLGGTALYAALLASRFGLRAGILTRGRFDNIESPDLQDALSRYAAEVEIIVQESDDPTVFTNVSVAGRREQTIHTWAGEIDLNGLPPLWRSSGIIHLAPVAQEIDVRRAGRLSPDYFGVTPQGLMRAWRQDRAGRVSMVPLRLPFEFLGRINGMVLDSEEQTQARDEVEIVGARGLVIITRGPTGAQVIDRGQHAAIPAFNVPVANDTGAGDVFAATTFILRHEGTGAIPAATAAAGAASLLIQRGGPDAIPTRDEVDAFLAEQDRKAQQRRRDW